MTRRLLRPRVLVPLAALLLLAALGLEVWRLGGAYIDLRAGRADLIAAATALEEGGLDIPPAELEQQDAAFASAARRIAAAAAVIEADPLLSIAGRLPAGSRQVKATRALVRIGEESAAIGREAVAAVRAYQALRDQDHASTLATKVVSLLDVMQARVGVIAARLAVIEAERASIGDAHGLAGPIAGAIETLDPHLASLRRRLAGYERARVIAPEFLGFNGRRTWLVLTQDNTELFATGGLISVYGLLTVERGSVLGLTFADVEELWAAWRARSNEYVPPPGPLQRYLLKDWSWNLGTSNWSPDFPTAARQAQLMLQKEGGPAVDGVIATNFLALESLLGVLGPIPMPEYNVTVRADGATELVLEQTHTPAALREGKQRFVARLGERIVARTLLAEPGLWTRLLASLQEIAAEKNLLLYSNSAGVQAAVEALGWSGSLLRESSDYLMLVDNSVRSTKLNLILQQRVDLSIRLDESGAAAKRVVVSYTNPYPQWARGKSADLTEQMLGGQYGGYLRLLAPRESLLYEVLQNGRTVSLEDAGLEGERAWFGSYFVVPPGASTSVGYVYVSPGVIEAEDGAFRYTLHLQKQPGTRGLPLRINVFLPPGRRLVSATLDGVPQPRGSVGIETDLRVDRRLVVRYR